VIFAAGAAAAAFPLLARSSLPACFWCRTSPNLQCTDDVPP
jgi:hypothetical protein